MPEPVTAMSLLQSALGLAAKPVETACNLIDNLLGEPCKVAGQMLSDQVYAWQWQNRVRIANRAKTILEEDEIAARVLPSGFLVPLLDAAGNVEAEELQELWARLLVSAIKSDDAAHPMFLEVLKQMSPADATLLNRLASNAFPGKEVDWVLASGSDAARSGARLIALNVMSERILRDPDKWRLDTSASVHITRFGCQFMDALGLRQG